MAEAQGKLSGRPGICFVTRGPGASNAAIGLHTAFQDSTPLIVFIGQVASDQRDREAFQEVDYRQMFGPGTLGFAKWVGEVQDADRLPEYVARAFHTAMQGRPGPVVLALPEDMLRALTAAPVLPRIEPALAAPAPEALARGRICSPPPSGRSSSPAAAAGRRRRAKRSSASPSAGSCRWAAPSASRTCSTTAIRTTPATSASASTRSSPRACRGRPDPGDGPAPGRDDDRRLRAAGAAAAEAEAGPPACRRRGARPGLCRRPAGAVVDGLRRAGARDADAPPAPRWAEWTRAAGADYEANRQPTPVAPLDMAEVVSTLARHLPADTVFTNGAGNFSGWLHRFYRYPGLRHAGAPSSRRPRGRWATACPPRSPRPCSNRIARVNLAGDGDFLMNGQELATAIAYGAKKLLTIVVDNGTYGTIRMHQEREFPGRVSGSDLVNPDFGRWPGPTAGRPATRRPHRAFEPALPAALARAAVADPHQARYRRDHQPDHAAGDSRFGRTTGCRQVLKLQRRRSSWSGSTASSSAPVSSAWPSPGRWPRRAARSSSIDAADGIGTGTSFAQQRGHPCRPLLPAGQPESRALRPRPQLLYPYCEAHGVRTGAAAS